MSATTNPSTGQSTGHSTGQGGSPVATAAQLVGDPGPSPAAYRAALVLEALARRREAMTLTEVAASLDLPKSSVANVLLSLEAAAMVRRSARGWLLGYKVLELSRSLLVSTDLVSEFRRCAAALPALRAETVLLAVLDGLEVIYVARSEGHQPIRFVNDIGSRNPAVVTGLGKAMMSALPDDDLDARLALIDELPLPTARSHRTVAALREDLMASRRRGHAVDEEEGVPGVICLAVPVPGALTPTAVSTTLLSRRSTPDLRAQLVRELHVLAGKLGQLEAS